MENKMNFDKYFNKYDNYSIIQEKVAKKLNELIIDNNIYKDVSSIFEIGCGTGLFTRNYLKFNTNLKNLILNDKFDVKNFLNDINYNDLIKGNIEEIDIPKVDLVVSSSVFQWVDDLEKLIKNISLSSDKLCFSTYTLGNLIEIKNHFGVSLTYKTHKEIEKIVNDYFKEVVSHSETVKINFPSPLDVLKHLKYTGVTGLQKPSINNVRTFDKKEITYEVSYFICEK